MVTAYLYTLIGLSDYSDCDIDTRQNMGWVLLGTIFVSTLVNTFKTLYLILRECRRIRDAKKPIKKYVA